MVSNYFSFSPLFFGNDPIWLIFFRWVHHLDKVSLFFLMFLWGILTNEQPHRHIQPDPTVIHRSFRESSGTNDLGGWFGTLHWNFLQLHLGGVRLVPGGGWQDAFLVDKITPKNGCMIFARAMSVVCSGRRNFFQGLIAGASHRIFPNTPFRCVEIVVGDMKGVGQETPKGYESW